MAKNLKQKLRELQSAAADYLCVTRTRGCDGSPAGYFPPANRSIQEIKDAENKLRSMLPNDQELSHAAGDSRQPETFPANLKA